MHLDLKMRVSVLLGIWIRLFYTQHIYPVVFLEQWQPQIRTCSLPAPTYSPLDWQILRPCRRNCRRGDSWDHDVTLRAVPVRTPVHDPAAGGSSVGSTGRRKAMMYVYEPTWRQCKTSTGDRWCTYVYLAIKEGRTHQHHGFLSKFQPVSVIIIRIRTVPVVPLFTRIGSFNGFLGFFWLVQWIENEKWWDLTGGGTRKIQRTTLLKLLIRWMEWVDNCPAIIALWMNGIASSDARVGLVSSAIVWPNATTQWSAADGMTEMEGQKRMWLMGLDSRNHGSAPSSALFTLFCWQCSESSQFRW